MSDKAKMGTFMGYGEDTEGYKVLLNGKNVLSRDVRLNEELRGPKAICGRTPAVSRGGAVGSPPLLARSTWRSIQGGERGPRG